MLMLPVRPPVRLLPQHVRRHDRRPTKERRQDTDPGRPTVEGRIQAAVHVDAPLVHPIDHASFVQALVRESQCTAQVTLAVRRRRRFLVEHFRTAFLRDPCVTTRQVAQAVTAMSAIAPPRVVLLASATCARLLRHFSPADLSQCLLAFARLDQGAQRAIPDETWQAFANAAVQRIPVAEPAVVTAFVHAFARARQPFQYALAVHRAAVSLDGFDVGTLLSLLVALRAAGALDTFPWDTCSPLIASRVPDMDAAALVRPDSQSNMLLVNALLCRPHWRGSFARRHRPMSP